MKKRLAKKIFVYGPIKWNVRLSTWDKVIDKLFDLDDTRKGWKNLMRNRLWEYKNGI